MYISIARYAGAAGKMAEAAPKSQQGFVPMLKGQPGFLGYANLASEQGDIVAIGIWENAGAQADSRAKILSWVSTNMPDFVEPTERSTARWDSMPSPLRRPAVRASPSTAW